MSASPEALDPYVRAAIAVGKKRNIDARTHISPVCVQQTVDVHDQTRGNYCWLTPLLWFVAMGGLSRTVRAGFKGTQRRDGNMENV